MSVHVKKFDPKTDVEKQESSRETLPAEGDLFHPLETLRHEIDRLFDDFFPGFGGRPMPWRGLDFDPFGVFRRMPVTFGTDMPRVDVSETEKEFLVRADLPGMVEDDIEVVLSEGTLTIKGKKSSERDETKEDFHLMERRVGSFRRSFRLPATVDEAKVVATFDQGVLTVTLPKTAETKKQEKKIKIKKTG